MIDLFSGDSVVAAPSLFQVSGSGAIPTSPLQFTFEQIPVELACELNKKWHSRLPRIEPITIYAGGHMFNVGAKYDGKWYAVGIWSSPVAQNRFNNGKEILELRRLAICEDAPANTATRMISIMVKLIRKKYPDIKRLISYQDTEVHLGTIYKASNWFVGAKNNGLSWTTKTRTRNKEQTMAPKVRWEYQL